jgi:hypothetical protein
MVLSALIHSPVGLVIVRSITASHSLRALFLCMDLLGSLMLATVFCSASGGALSKKSPKGCEASCDDPDSGVDQETCYYMQFGRLIAIGVVSALVAGVPIAILNSLHQREFVRVPYEGSPNWHAQLRSWRRRDRLIWIIGIAYCLFAVNYVCLFFANVAEIDQADWIISAGISFLEDFVVLPVALAFAFTSFALVLLACLSRRHGLQRSQITQHGSIDRIREVFSNSDKVEIRRQLTSESLAFDKERQNGSNHSDDKSWDHFDILAFHDTGRADLAHLQRRFVG